MASTIAPVWPERRSGAGGTPVFRAAAPQLRLAPSLAERPVAALCRRPPSGRLHGLGWSLLSVFGLLTAALLLAPEGAADQAAICQRHNGVAACRVW